MSPNYVQEESLFSVAFLRSLPPISCICDLEENVDMVFEDLMLQLLKNIISVFTLVKLINA